MDYTIAPYTPAYEELQFQLTINNLIKLYKYPEDIKSLQYDKLFAVKGLFLDTHLGNILKVDQFGYIHLAFHGKTRLTDKYLRECYKDKTVSIVELEGNERYQLQSSAFAAPLVALCAALIEYFEEKQALRDPLNDDNRVRLQYKNLHDISPQQLCYENLFSDINKALGAIHGAKAELKQITQKDPEKYIIKSDKLPKMLENLKAGGKITFLLTNSGFEYTNAVLIYLLGADYHKYLDYIIVDAQKPTFFTGHNAFREVINGQNSITSIGKLSNSKIYAYGNQKQFCQFLKLRTKDILYCGDHIVGDTGATKNELMRTLFICPEIKEEIRVMQTNSNHYKALSTLEGTRKQIQAEYCKRADLRHVITKPAELIEVQEKIDKLTAQIDALFNPYFGSIFTTTWGKTWLGQYVEQNSDLYTGELTNLVNYPPYYKFSPLYDCELPHQENFIQQIKLQNFDILIQSIHAPNETKLGQSMKLKDYQSTIRNELESEPDVQEETGF